MSEAKWQVYRVHGVEVFVSPDGVEYVRTSDPALADYTHEPKIRGLPKLYLRRQSAEAIRQRVERKARRLQRRTARLQK